MTDIDLPLADVTLRATVTGAGPTVLLLHAGRERRGVWAPVAARLAASGLRTVAFDLRGHGDSSGQATTLRAVAADVVEMIIREPAPIVVVGASLGGVAAIAALADPVAAARVAGLVLVDVVPDTDEVRGRSWLETRVRRKHRAHHVDLVRDLFASGPGLLATATTLDVPVLLVRAGGHSPVGDADADRLRAANPRVTVTAVPRAGHLIAQDAPAELARIVSVHACAWLGADDLVARAFALQRTLGVGEVDHPGGTLYEHLRRVHALTVDWVAAPRVQRAAICHATYGTDGFRHALLPTTERHRLRDVVGPDAEALVYLYGACDRARTYPRPSRHVDRFTGAASTLRGADLRDFAVLTIANELDVARHARMPASARREIKDLVTALAGYAPQEAARALADEALA